MWWLLFIICSTLPLITVGKPPVVKAYRDKTVYTLDNGVLHVIPDWETFVGLGYDANEIKTLEDEKIQSYPIGDPASQIQEKPRPKNPFKGCPCISDDMYEQSLHPHEAKVHKFCFVESEQVKEFLDQFDHKLMNIDHKIISAKALAEYTFLPNVTASAEMQGCDIVLNLLPGHDFHDMRNSSLNGAYDKYACPEMCKPIPITEMPLSWLMAATSAPPPEQSPMHKQFSTLALTCSMTYRELWEDRSIAMHHHNGMSQLNHERAHVSMGNVLRAIARRRFEECNEHHLWPPAAQASPRVVHGLILWIGSRTRYSLMRSQLEILRNQSSDPSIRIMGWMASEDQYDCNVASSLCYDATSSNAYFPLMPTTRMHFASAGWSCAQRRMLRALQHVMLLFDPQFIMVADDDTYVNIQMLNPGGRLDNYIRTELSQNLDVVGALTLGRKVTKKGFYWGGAGYLFGRQIIENLNSKILHGPAAAEDNFRDEGKMRYLHVMKEAHQKSRAICESCMTFDKEPPIWNTEENLIDIVGASANLTIRVIELCTNLMSQEHTCYHSDHAMSRCLLYAANGYPVNADCFGSKIGKDGVLVGMCMGTDACTADQLTCHRFYPHPDNALLAKGQYI